MKKKRFTWCCIFIAMLILLACSDNEDKGSITGPDDPIQDVAGFVAAVCELAASCPGISATQDDINTYVAQIQDRFSQSQIEEMEVFATYTKAQQDCILICIGGRICSRFGGAISSMSDSDVIEPLRACQQECL
jgi:hypothetical protein